VRRSYLETARGRFAALEAFPSPGVPERSPALLVPGLPGSKEDFIAILQSLAQAGRRVVAIDMRGQHETPGPDDPAAYTCAELGADITAVLETFGSDHVHVTGHSFGGLVTREAVLSDASRMISYTLMSSGPGAITGQREIDGRKLITALPKVGLAQLWAEAMEPDVVAKGVPPEIIEFLRTRLFSSSLSGLLAMAEAALTCPDRVDELAKAVDAAELPVQVLYGENDDGWTPQAQAGMAERLAARKVVIPGAMHSPAVEAPETTASALTTFWNTAEKTRRQPAPMP
jgi:pimeloyl-ACP methyl ester carboxylesterase